ncbi:uncharacterized protein STEHIDRAFT_118387 [Stereum hirsutum FP-91666 SS1]|uniref:uncharacterized protein n=1 Tax=Stereum hirsutum (strain FP-91666) TaxID=721885 RepID=UPI000440CD37|nr:uncharacterized protein STEHIDRAFT_118387 [Stereum hirsutum FP-91666 SS1]EIM91285.1 hypothetical protein STEHIDRAFT_118387 [Stereum hirsutum FP-91666 SS1]
MPVVQFCLRLIVPVVHCLFPPLPPRPPRRRKFLERYFPSRCDLASATGDLRRSQISATFGIQVVVRLNQTRARPRHNPIELEEQTHTFDEWINYSTFNNQPRTIGWLVSSSRIDASRSSSHTRHP